MMKIYATLLISLALLSGCSNYLDKLPENKSAVEDIDYSKSSDMYNPVAGVYGTAGQKISDWMILGLLSVRGDDIDKGSTDGDQPQFQQAKEFNYAPIKSFWALNTAWENLYSLALNCNGALEALDNYNAELASSDNEGLNLNKQYKAEVRFVRAYAYFLISRLWKDAPLIVNNVEVQNNPPKTSRADMYAFLDSELDTCIMYLPNMRPNQMTRSGEVTKYSALALKAKINADQNKWEEVANSTDQIINSGLFSLYSNFYNYFKSPGILADENLYELQFYKTESKNIGSSAWFNFQFPRGIILRAHPTVNNMTMDGGWGFMVPSQKLKDILDSRGESVRMETTVLPMSSINPVDQSINYSITRDGDTLDVATTGTPNAYNGKVFNSSIYLPNKITSCGGDNSIRLLRYADVLLLNAEAKVRLGSAGDGDASLNIVRNRAQMSPLSGATVDQILEERNIELAGEWGERFFDLVRSGKAASTLPGFVVGESEFYPIPQNQVNLNPNLAD